MKHIWLMIIWNTVKRQPIENDKECKCVVGAADILTRRTKSGILIKKIIREE